MVSSDWIQVSDWETRQEKWTPTREVLDEYTRLSQQETNPFSVAPGSRVDFKLLCGADLLESFSVPGLWKEEDKLQIVRVLILDLRKRWIYYKTAKNENATTVAFMYGFWPVALKSNIVLILYKSST